MALRPFVIDYVALREAILAALRLATGLDEQTARPSEPEGPNWTRPDLPYVTTKFLSPAIRRGGDSLELVDASAEVWNLGGQRQLAVSFQAYGQSHEQAYGLLSTWQSALDSEPVLELLRRSKISVLDVGAVTDISALLNTGYEGRASLDVQFGTVSNLSVGLGIIRAATIRGEAVLEDETIATIDVSAET